MTKKILVINTSGKNSGAEFSLITMLKKCTGPDLAFTVVTPKNQLLESMSGDGVQVTVFDMVNLNRPHHFSNSLTTLYRFFRSFLTLYLWARKEKIDLLYANNIKAATYGVLLKLFLFKKLIWHSRDNNTNRVVLFFITLFADRIICISNYIEGQIKWNKHKVRLAYPLVQFTDSKEPLLNDDIRSLLGLPKETILVAQVAQIVPWKNHGVLLDIARKLKDKNAHFLIVGEALCHKDELHKQALEAQVHRDGLYDKISFLGFQSNIQSVLSQVDILVHPVANEPFGRVMLEAQLSKTPVVSIKAGGASEIIENGKTGFLVNDLCADQLAEKVDLLIGDSELREAMGKAAQCMASKKFNIKTHSKLLYDHLTIWE